jgi:hypothetical protein
MIPHNGKRGMSRSAADPVGEACGTPSASLHTLTLFRLSGSAAPTILIIAARAPLADPLKVHEVRVASVWSAGGARANAPRVA